MMITCQLMLANASRSDTQRVSTRTQAPISAAKPVSAPQTSSTTTARVTARVSQVFQIGTPLSASSLSSCSGAGGISSKSNQRDCSLCPARI